MKHFYRNFILHTDFLIMAVLALFLAVYLFLASFHLSSLVCWIIGLVVFMFSEYFTHRFFFHLKAPSNPYFLKLLKRLHYDHHTDPQDLKLLFLPVWYSLPNFTVLVSLFFLFSQSLQAALAFGLGLICMLLFYEWKHYVAHRPAKPKTRFGKWLKKSHLLHHYKNEKYWFGVSTPFVDALFGTLKDEKKVSMSETAKDLEGR
ncbi:sterol desaturase family protein [Metabacillus sp. GX 13764]|uniref:sterol desaturase family protein n=1 Tax=Metabacillus kandeliae TaxID=2900151 RepID=UPI001E4BE7B8|nr:sterol desaturase family protein [Metabacillus kandeliae]MCD7035663.1 sterol desaturase family protein [Metabacillus kandeliae]